MLHQVSDFWRNEYSQVTAQLTRVYISLVALRKDAVSLGKSGVRNNDATRYSDARIMYRRIEHLLNEEFEDTKALLSPEEPSFPEWPYAEDTYILYDEQPQVCVIDDTMKGYWEG